MHFVLRVLLLVVIANLSTSISIIIAAADETICSSIPLHNLTLSTACHLCTSSSSSTCSLCINQQHSFDCVPTTALADATTNIDASPAATTSSAASTTLPSSLEESDRSHDPPPSTLNEDWSHGWDNFTSQMWVDFAGTNYRWFPSDEQWEFVASAYAIVSLEKCFAQGPFPATEDAVVAGARKIKRYNPNTKVLYYIHSSESFSNCYRYGKQILADPSWWLRDDASLSNFTRGVTPAPYFDPQPHTGNRMYDFNSAAVRDFFVNNISAGGTMSTWTEQDAADGIIDGVFADHVTSWQKLKGMNNKTRYDDYTRNHLESVNASRAVVRRRFASRLTPTPKVFGNSFFFYPFNPSDGVPMLDYVDGVCAEHWLSFEMLKSGWPKPAVYARAIAAIGAASRRRQPVLVRAFPGPASQPIVGEGPGYGAASGLPMPGSNQTLRAEMFSRFVVPLLASYLIVASPFTFFSYNWWYEMRNGVVPSKLCGRTLPNGKREVCGSPYEWPAEFMRGIGEPLGGFEMEDTLVDGRTRVIVYRRRFKLCNVTFNVSDIERSVIEWHDAGVERPATGSSSRSRSASSSGEQSRSKEMTVTPQLRCTSSYSSPQQCPATTTTIASSSTSSSTTTPSIITHVSTSSTTNSISSSTTTTRATQTPISTTTFITTSSSSTVPPSPRTSSRTMTAVKPDATTISSSSSSSTTIPALPLSTATSTSLGSSSTTAATTSLLPPPLTAPLATPTTIESSSNSATVTSSSSSSSSSSNTPTTTSTTTWLNTPMASSSSSSTTSTINEETTTTTSTTRGLETSTANEFAAANSNSSATAPPPSVCFVGSCAESGFIIGGVVLLGVVGLVFLVGWFVKKRSERAEQRKTHVFELSERMAQEEEDALELS